MTDTTPKELLPCPWGCNSQPEALVGRRHFVTCPACCAMGPEKNTSAEAIAAWNTRPVSTPNPKVGELADELERRALDRRNTRGSDGRWFVPVRSDELTSILTALRSIPEDGVERENARLREALMGIIRKWETNDASANDEWSDGYEDALEECAKRARSALSSSSDIPGEGGR